MFLRIMMKSKIEVDLKALDKCELDLAWTFVRSELEKTLSRSTLLCVPSFRDSELFDNSCVFVQTPPNVYVPLGNLQDLIDKDNTDPFWYNIHDETAVMKDDGLPPDFELGLRDRARRRKVDVRAMRLIRRRLFNTQPKEHQVSLNPRARPELATAETIHFVYDVIGADELIFSTSDEVNVDLYSIVTWKPILIGFKTFQLDKEHRITGEISETKKIYRTVQEAWSSL